MASEFGVLDYIVFACMLLISSGIGLYYGCSGGKQKTTKEYLMADRSMKSWPIAISLLASYLSAITLLGVPSEIYTYGGQYFVLIISYLYLTSMVAIIFVPVFHGLKLTSANEYLEQRFNYGVRLLGCLLFILEMVLYLSVVLYAPSLALQAVAGVPLAASIITTGVVCTFYTTLGGLKAVVWTDVFQAGVMIAGLVTVFIVGVLDVGGLGKVWEIANEGKRLDFFDFNPDPTIRNTFWTLSIGGAFTAAPVWTVSQTAVQRFLASKTERQARIAVWLNIPGLIFVVSLCCIDGLVIYAVYHTCDLKTEKLITSNDQVLPYFVIDKLGHLPGVAGIFTACLFSGALSTASSGFNSLATVTLEDIVKKVMRDLTEAEATRLAKIIACSYGVLIIAGAFIVKYVGTMVLQLAYSIFGIVGGPCLGIFLLGIMVRRSNSKGCFVGCFVGVFFTLWVVIGAMMYPPNKFVAPVSEYGCSFFNSTITNSTGIIEPTHEGYDFGLSKLYSLSYLWYSATGIFTTFFVGLVASLLLESEEDRKREIDPRLLFNYSKFFSSLIPCRQSASVEISPNIYLSDMNNKKSEDA